MRHILLKNAVILLVIISQMILFTPFNVQAGFDKLVKDVFPAGTMSNVTKSSMVKEQAAGHILGGSIIVKAPATPPLQLVQATAPSYKFGGLPCGAQFEFLGGGLSIASGKEIVNYIKGLPKAAALYGAMMAIKTLCPHCQDLIEYLDAKADWLNKMSFDKCHAIQSLMDPMFPKQDAKGEGLRQSRMMLTGGGKDMSYVQKQSKIDDGTDPTAGVGELESQFGNNYNIVWKALEKKVPNSGADAVELKEMLMSISGTVIGIKGADKKYKVKYLKSLVKKELLEDFIGANSAKNNKVRLFKCDEAERCLNPVATDRAVNKDSYLYQKVQKLVGSIVEKILTNSGELTSEEETIVALSSEQLILKIEMDLATYAGKANVINNQTEYIESLSYDVVTGYLQALLTEVQEAVSEIGEIQIGDREKILAFEQESREVMNMLSDARIEARGKFEVIANSKERLRRDIDYFDRAFESFIGSHDQ